MTHSRGTIRFVCSNCIAPLEARRRQAGTRMRCPWCQTALVVPQESSPDAPAETYALAEGTAPAPAADAESGFYVTCLVCRTRMHASADQVGRLLVCPDCGTSTVVSGPSRGPIPPPAAPASAKPAEIYEVSKEEGQPLPTDSEVYRLYIPVVCTLCHTRMHATEEQAGQTVVCPDCGTRNVVPQPGEALGAQASVPEPQEGYRLAEPSAESGEERPSSPRLYVYKCPVCHTRLHATRAEAGHATACPDCSTKFTIPPPPSDQPDWDPFEGAAEVYALAASPAAPTPQKDHSPPATASGTPTLSEIVRQPLADREPIVPRRPRPELPPWPLVNGVFAFPFYRESRAAWIAFSIGNLVMWGVLIFTWQVLVVVAAIMLLIGLMYFVWASKYCLTILTETANGVERIEDWSSSDVVERAFQALYLLNSLILSILFGWGLEYLAGSLPQGIAPAATMFVLFPIILLSMLERGTVLNPVSPPVWWSVLANGWAWLGFYVLAGLLVSAVVALDFGLRRLLGIWGSGLTAVLMATALMIYFRLLGRLGWYCSQRSRGRSRSSDK